MQLTINRFRPLFLTRLFPDTSLTFSKTPNTSLTAVKIPDISRFSRQVVTPLQSYRYYHKFTNIITTHTTTKATPRQW